MLYFVTYERTFGESGLTFERFDFAPCRSASYTPGEDSFRRCDVCEGRARYPLRVKSGERNVMQRFLHKRRCDYGRLL